MTGGFSPGRTPGPVVFGPDGLGVADGSDPVELAEGEELGLELAVGDGGSLGEPEQAANMANAANRTKTVLPARMRRNTGESCHDMALDEKPRRRAVDKPR
jgi:hypothetical protein